MPRANRRRDSEGSDLDIERILSGFRRTEVKRGAEWTVQPMSAVNAVKSYTCPGCRGEIAPGTAHVVVWRADGIFGPESDLAERRHWHSRCWSIA